MQGDEPNNQTSYERHRTLDSPRVRKGRLLQQQFGFPHGTNTKPLSTMHRNQRSRSPRPEIVVSPTVLYRSAQRFRLRLLLPARSGPLAGPAADPYLVAERVCQGELAHPPRHVADRGDW